jgi:cytochrome c oxidase subunit 3
MVSYMNGYIYSLLNVKLGFILVLSLILVWLYDITAESIFLGYHSFKVSKGIILGFILFIITEIMLFFSLFWAYFHSALNPTDLLWPPISIDLVNPWSIPFLNTILLLYSGVAATWGHHEFLASNKSYSLYSLGIAIILGLIFVFCQYFEYVNSSFDITDSVFSSTFYLLTGMHGFHTLYGVIMLSFVWYRLYINHYPIIFYDLALLYYHMVDVIWINLFILVYYLSY